MKPKGLLKNTGIPNPSSQGSKSTSKTSSKPSVPSQPFNVSNPFGGQTQEEFIGKDNAARIKKETASKPIPSVNKTQKEIDATEVPKTNFYGDVVDFISSPIQGSARLFTDGLQAGTDALFGKRRKTMQERIEEVDSPIAKAPQKQFDAEYIKSVSENVNANKFADDIEKSGEPNAKKIAEGVRERNKQWFNLPVSERKEIREFDKSVNEEKNLQNLEAFNAEQEKLTNEIWQEEERLKNTVSGVGSREDFQKLNLLNNRLNELKVKKNALELKPEIFKSNIFKDDNEILDNLGSEMDEVLTSLREDNPSKYERLSKQFNSSWSNISSKEKKELITEALNVKQRNLENGVAQAKDSGELDMVKAYGKEVDKFNEAVKNGDEATATAQQSLLQSYKEAGVDNVIEKLKGLSKQEEDIADVVETSAIKYDIFEDEIKQAEVDKFVEDNPILGRAWEFAKSAYSILPKTVKSGIGIGEAIGSTLSGDSEAGIKNVGVQKFKELVDGFSPTQAKLGILKGGNNDIDWKNLVNFTGNQIATMAVLLQGGGTVGNILKGVGAPAKIAQSVGLMASSYAISKDDYYDHAVEQGMKSKDATLFANQAAGLTSLLELISPNDMILTGKIKSEITKDFAKYFTKGGLKYALGQSSKRIAKETLGKELPQEVSQLLGDKFLQLAYNRTDGTKFNENIDHKELKETVIGTLAATSVLTALRNKQVNKQEKQQYLYEASKDLNVLQETLKGMKLSESDVAKVMEQITPYNKAHNAMPQDLDEDTKKNVAPLLVAKDKLQQQANAENLDPAFKTAINERIKVIDNTIVGLVNGKFDPNKVVISDDPIDAVKNTEEAIKEGTNVVQEEGLEEGKEKLDAFENETPQETKPVDVVKVAEEVITPKEEVKVVEEVKPIENETKPIVPKTENVEKVKVPVKEETGQVEPPVKSYGYEDIDAMVDENVVARELNQEIIDPTELTPVQQAIRQFGGVTTTEESYAQFGDKNNLSKEARKTSIRKNAQSLDALAEEISANGLEVTPADLVDYIDTFADGDNKLSNRAEALKEKMFDLTGKKFNKYTISKYVDKINAKARERFLAEMDAPSLSPEEIGIIEQNGINTENIDDIAQKLDWLYEPETFENIKAYLKNENKRESGSSNESGKSTERVSEKGDGVEKQPKAGDSARNFANKIREGKINKLGGFRAGTGFDAAWDLGLETIALSIEGGAKIADAIQSGLEAIKKTDWYKGLQDKENFDKQYNDHMQNEYNVVSKESTGITKEQIDATRKELGLEEVKRVSKSDIELKKQADEWMEKNSIPDLITKLEKGALPSDIENVVMRNYISSLEAKNDKSPSAELLKDINRATKVITSARSELGRALRSGVGEIAIEDNLSNFLLDEMDAMGVNTMPQSMIDELAEKYAKGKAAKDAYEEGYEKAKQEFIKEQAEKALAKERAKARSRGGVKKTAAEFESERDVFRKNIRNKAKQARSQLNAVPLPYVAELIAIAPDVAKLVRSYVEQGVSKLDDLVKKIQSDLGEDIEGITENDVRDLIAGEYNAKRPTKNQITADIRELRQQAKLLKQIEDLENGKLPMTESGKIRRTQEIDKLKERIKELEDETGISEAKSIKAKRNYLDKQIDKLRDDLETGNYDVENPVPRKMKLDPETQAKQDEYIKFQKETWKRRDAAKYEQLSKPRKAWEKFQQFLGLRRLIQTSLDFSMPFRQAITLTLNPRYVRITAESFANMFKGWASEKQFDRIMFAIENDPLYKDMLEDKLVFSDVDSKDNLKRDEDFRTSFLYHIPYLRLPFLASNRAAAGFVNTARYELYLKGVERLKSAKITRETNPEHYKSMANWVMNMTGRGKLLEFMENSVQAQRVLGDTFYGARLMASRFNLLNPNTYIKMPKEVRVEALKDIGAYASVAAATLIGLAVAGATVSLDPDDPDFLKAKWGDKRYDFTTGGMSVYLRFYFKLAKAIVQRLNPKIYGEDKDKALLKKYDKYGSHALKNSTNFFRYKLAPNTSYVISGIAGKDALGNEFDPSEFLNFYPMYTEDMIDAYKKDEGALSTFTVLLPNLFGVGVQEYSNKKQSGEAKTPAERERMRNESRREREKSREDSRNNR